MNKVRDVTIIFGPPGPEDEKRKFEEWSKNSGKPKDEIWLEYVHEILSGFANHESPETPSMLDELLSRVFRISVRVTDPFMTDVFEGGVRSPGLILYTNKISAQGRENEINWSGPQVREAIGSIFGYLLKAEWVRTFVAYEPTPKTLSFEERIDLALEKLKQQHKGKSLDDLELERERRNFPHLFNDKK